MAWYKRLSNIFRRETVARDIDRELSFHIEERVDELVASGKTEEEARRAARRQFGNVALEKERTRDADLLTSVETVARDVRFAARTLRTNLAFTLAATISLGLGIGANAAIFTLINTLFLNPLPVHEPSRLIAVYSSDSKGTGKPSLQQVSHQNLLDLRAQNQVLEDLAWYSSPSPMNPVRWIELPPVRGVRHQ